VFGSTKVRVTGNPVRRKFLDAVTASGRVRVAGGSPRLLVVGGSQGARTVNDLVLGAAEVLAGRGQLPALVHQTGSADVERCSSRYHALGVADRATVRPFIEDMVAAYREADLVIGRAGALTLAELAILGRPALLIPLPTAADDHQTRNAQAFVRAGAAVVVEQRGATAEALADTIAAVLADAPRRAQMADAMRALSRPDAARQIADELVALARDRETP
jgi:UDP-N-acetylglucosamine--N-acetylmuramyl-(pentapeptide) pyrophosphoryl-undecaprenol N-acetylglucosamine transferase